MIGVRDPKLFDSIVYKLTDSGSNSAGSKSSSGSSGSNNWFSSSSSSSSKVRSILLDTTCAQAHTESLLSTMTNSDKNSNILRKTIESLQHMLSQLNSNGFTVHINRSSTIRSSSSSSKSHSDINKSLSEYYQNLLLIKFVLSPSLPTSLSHCEWEALAAGAIPIVDAATITHPSIRALYEGLPVLYINSWSEVTFSYLQSQYDLLTSSSSDSVSMSKSIEKIYFPYWLDKLTKHLISGM